MSPIEYDTDAQARWQESVRYPGNLDCTLFHYLCWAIAWANQPSRTNYDEVWKLIDKEIKKNQMAGHW